jgi:heterodisulfide reductase subunit A
MQAVEEREESRIGIYVCHCGSNIAGVVDCAAVAAYGQTLPDVIVSRHDGYLCSEPGQNQIKTDIREQRLNRIVVASCSPRLHEPTFRKCLAEAGLNPYLLEMANLREQCSWVHSHDPEGATQKSKDLVRSAVARARWLGARQEAEVLIEPATLVIGGGVAGIQAALFHLNTRA